MHSPWKFNFRRTFWKIVSRFNFDAYVRHMERNCSEDEDRWELKQVLYTWHWLDRAHRLNLNEQEVVGCKGPIKRQWADCEEQYFTEPDLRSLKRAVEKAEHERAKRSNERREPWIKWITAVAAIVAACASLYGVWLQRK